MRNLVTIATAFILALTFFACNKTPKAMTVQDYAKIDMEITTTDLTPESKKKVAEKYGFTLEQYEAFDEKVAKDKSLQEKLGEIRMDEQKKLYEQKK